jgi:hypothetical protein
LSIQLVHILSIVALGTCDGCRGSIYISALDFSGWQIRGSSGHKTENMYVDHMVDAVFGEWHGTFTLKTHYVDFKRKKRVIT